MALDMSKLINAMQAAQRKASQSLIDPNKETYKMTDPSPELNNGDIVEICLDCVKNELINPNQIYYEAVIIGRGWNQTSQRWDWIVDLGNQFIKDVEGDGKRKNYRYQAMIAAQDLIVKDKPLEFSNKLSKLNETNKFYES